MAGPPPGLLTGPGILQRAQEELHLGFYWGTCHRLGVFLEGHSSAQGALNRHRTLRRSTTLGAVQKVPFRGQRESTTGRDLSHLVQVDPGSIPSISEGPLSHQE